MLEEENKLAEPLEDAAMFTLNSHQGAWTNREEIWVLRDRRLLFATKSGETTSQWVTGLSDLVNQQNTLSN